MLATSRPRRTALTAEGLTERVTLLVAPRHDLDWPIVAQFYPPRRVICLTAKDRFEAAKESVWQSRGERVHVFEELGPTEVLTTTAIRAQVATGADWTAFIPQACHSYFEEIDGPRRVFDVT